MNLTPRQLETLTYAAHGLTYQEIATEQGVSYSAVHRNLSLAFDRLGVAGQGPGLTLAAAFRAMGWLTPPIMRTPGSDAAEHDRAGSPRAPGVAVTPASSTQVAA
jgi:hypothetical protein